MISVSDSFVDDPVAVDAESLDAINEELAALVRRPPADLIRGAERSGRDELVICGILGGKDVGKSTLINALAGQDVSVDPAEVGRGTQHPVVYVHETMHQAAASRLQTGSKVIDVVTHRVDAIRNVVLVDFPDFDSEFDDHRETVRTVAPLLDRIIWVQTPRKIADRAWVAMLRDIVKDERNVCCVVNKVDELLADVTPGDGSAQRSEGNHWALRFWKDQQDRHSTSLARAGYPASRDDKAEGETRRDRLFLIAALYPQPERFTRRIGQLWDDPDWNRYTSERSRIEQIGRLVRDDLERLRASVLSPVSSQEERAIKGANRARQQQVNVERIFRHYDLDRVIARLAHACDPDYQQQVLDEAMGPEYRSAITLSLEARMRPDAELADDLFRLRVERWPLLRLVYWPLGWLSRTVGRRLSGAAGGPQGGTPGRSLAVEPTDLFEIPGPPLHQRIDAMRSRLLADHGDAVRQLGLAGELPDAAALTRRVRVAADRLPALLESRLIDAIGAQDRSPSLMGRAGLWLILLWFPFVQPILAGLLEMFREEGAWRLAHGMYRIVTAFSAVHLLAGFAVVAVVYLGTLAIMYSRARRAVRGALAREEGGTVVPDALHDLLGREVLVPLAAPFEHRLRRLTGLRNVLTTCRA